MAAIDRTKQQELTRVRQRNHLAPVLRHLAVLGAGAGFLLGVSPAIALDIFPYDASSRNRFDDCTLDLIQRKVAPSEAAQACASNLRPENLRRCVVQISGASQLAPNDILSACRQVRQPVSLASCFTDLQRHLQNVTETDILNNCKANLLPQRFAQCARGVARAPEISGTQALTDCNDAGVERREFAPSFIPYTVLPSEQLQVQPTNPDLLSPMLRPVAPVAPAPTQPTTPAPLPQKY